MKRRNGEAKCGGNNEISGIENGRNEIENESNGVMWQCLASK
jgi:hypothetical protein